MSADGDSKLEYRPIRHGEFETPDDFFIAASKLEGPFDLDAAASDENAKCVAYYTKDDDGLGRKWDRENIWVNPPYGRGLGRWLSKATREVRRGRCVKVVMLLPARTDTKWWHRYVMLGAQRVYLIKGRLKFGGYKSGAAFPSALVVFERPYRRPEFFSFDARTGKVASVQAVLDSEVVK